jgi:hypothetical protein
MEKRQNSAALNARAFATYSLVPYLGILFCPGTLVFGSLGLIKSYKGSQIGGRATSYFSLLAGTVVLILQLLLWWVLYKVPFWARGF